MFRRCFLLTLVLVVIGSGFALAQENAGDGQLIVKTLDKLNEILSKNLDSSNTLGIPGTIGDTTIIPIVAKGLGFGMGGGITSQETKDGARDKDGIGCGGGGFIRPIAIMVLKKDGTFQIHRVNESWLAEAIKQIVPVIQNMLRDRLEMRKMHLNRPPEPPEAAKPGQ